MYLIFVSSLNANMKLATSIKNQMKENNTESAIINLVDLELPMYDSRKEDRDGIPVKIGELVERMKKADGYIFVAPEYNYSLPPVLSNFVAWVSRCGEDFREVFQMKKIQLATHSGSGGHDLMNAMRTQFTRLGAIVMPREIITNFQKPLQLESSQKILKQFILQAE
ncbi:NADPH-dependent FMN reductase [Sulfurovum mangrovi]|uniref:NADPH-dependent FMN reductase n=1 Tax=Sulfurovum mangrovi TaxID=2893889 RepID=UPI001E4DE90D|nr:NAD(P)H-dependent oxidoreductase [Sulfurovum mangrovi]UFH60270.1 NAD(P)H-dependent oxidoreductase [Sulfurovum mangrovi]